MSAFDADWLALREPADGRARDAALRDAAAAWCAARPGDRPVRIVDLACGTGSTLRALAPAIARAQAWTLVDHDPALLARAGRVLADLDRIGTASGPVPVAIRMHRADLDAALDAVLDPDADLVATSAFLDLVSDAWLARLVDGLAARGRPFYAALSVDGRIDCDPVDPIDPAVFAAFDTHQRRDKGLGGALGPRAPVVAAARFAAAGFAVREARADWRLDAARPADAALLEPLLDGWHDAVSETGLLPAAALEAWRTRRRDAIRAGRLRVVVGHVDLWASPPLQAPAGRTTSQSTSSPSA
jgi:SAM-dependent methyltransferase